MIKGIKRGWGPDAPKLRYCDELVVPIVENTNQERDLRDRMARAMEECVFARHSRTVRSFRFSLSPTQVSRSVRRLGAPTWRVRVGRHLAAGQDHERVLRLSVRDRVEDASAGSRPGQAADSRRSTLEAE